MAQQNLTFCSVYIPAENFLESLLYFFGVKQLLD